MSDTSKKISAPPPCYALIYAALVPVARQFGYALALHGSMARDCDIVAIPWTEEATEPKPMIEALKAAAEGVWTHHEWDHIGTTAYHSSQKPHGRRAWSIHLTNNGCLGPYLDISVIPRISSNACASLPTQRTDSDCFSACLSWLLKLPQDEVPDFTDREDPNSGRFYHNVADFLNARGLRMMMIEWRAMPAWIGGPVIARGTSPREKAHAVLWDDDGLMHDPHPSRAGLVGEPTHAMLILSHNKPHGQTP